MRYPSRKLWPSSKIKSVFCFLCMPSLSQAECRVIGTSIGVREDTESASWFSVSTELTFHRFLASLGFVTI